MTAEKLRRVTLVEPQPVQTGPEKVNQAEIIRDAEKRLGYKPENPPVIVDLGSEPPLHKALRIAGINPFHWRSVDWYKKTKNLNFSFLLLRLLGKIADKINSWDNVFLVATLLSMIAGLISGSVSGICYLTEGTPFGLKVFIVCLFVFLVSVGLKIFSSRYFYEITGVWEMVQISQYKEPIPTDVLALALEVKDHVPGAEILVDVFRVKYRTLDPFLVVRYGNETYYIAVWDEPDFTPTL